MVYTPMVYNRGMTEEQRDARRRRSLLQVEGTGWDVGNAVLYLPATRRAGLPASCCRSTPAPPPAADAFPFRHRTSCLLRPRVGEFNGYGRFRTSSAFLRDASGLGCSVPGALGAKGAKID